MGRDSGEASSAGAVAPIGAPAVERLVIAGRSLPNQPATRVRVAANAPPTLRVKQSGRRLAGTRR
jgi:hypothetical protein